MRSQLRAALAQAIRSGDSVAVSALRSALAAIGNAEAVEAGTPGGSPGADPLGPAGAVGATDVPRRQLTEADLAQTVRVEITERLTAAGEYERLGQPERAERLRGEANVLGRFVPH